MNELSASELKFIVSRILDNANETIEESKSSGNDKFIQGKKLAYYEVLDTIKSELEVRDISLKEFGLDIDLEKML